MGMIVTRNDAIAEQLRFLQFGQSPINCLTLIVHLIINHQFNPK